MSHTTKCVNGIDVKVWDGASDRMGVESEARKFAAKLPRGGVLGDDKGHIDRVEGPAHVGGNIDVWLKGQVLCYEAPDGYTISDVSVFESGRASLTLTPE